MTAVLLMLVLTLASLRVLAGSLSGAVARRATEVTNVYPTPAPTSGQVDVAALDDTAFRVWLGVLPASYDRYVDAGLDDLEIFLADQPVHQVDEDPAEPSA